MKAYDKVVRKLVRVAKEHGFNVTAVHDGEEWVKTATEKEVVDAVMSVEESNVRMRNAAGERLTYFIVLGNDLSETICDYSYQEHLEEVADKIATTVSDHFQ